MLSRNSNLFTAIIVGVVGILLIVLHDHIDLLDWVSVAVGLMFILPSLYVLCSSFGRKNKLPVGIAFVSVGGIVLGLLMCVFPDAFAQLFVYVFAAMLVIFGVYQIVDVASWGKTIRLSAYFYLIPVLLVATGVIMLSTSLRKINTVVVLVTGIAMLAFSVNTVCEFICTRKSVRSIEP